MLIMSNFRVIESSKYIGKEVSTKYFLLGDLKLNLFWLGFPNYLYWCVDLFWCLVFAASLLNLSRKKEEVRFLGGLKWLWLGN